MIQAISYHAEAGLALFLISVALASHRLVPIETLYVRKIDTPRVSRVSIRFASSHSYGIIPPAVLQTACMSI